MPTDFEAYTYNVRDDRHRQAYIDKLNVLGPLGYAWEITPIGDGWILVMFWRYPDVEE